MKVELNNQKAFTLIEMILAIGIAAIVLIAINAVLFAALRLREATSDAVDEATPVDLATATIRRDLACAVNPMPNGNSSADVTGTLSGDFKVGNVTTPGISEVVAAEIYTATGALSADAPWGDIQRVTYELKNSTSGGPGMDLYRSITRNLLTETTPDVEDQLMLHNVESIKFSCYDGAQWDDTWDTTDPGSISTNLPVAVRVEIQPAGNDANVLAPIEILVPIDSQSRSNSPSSSLGS